MALFEEKLEQVNSLINSLTWKKIAMFGVLMTVVAFFIAAFENRNSLYEFTTDLTTIEKFPKRKISKDTIEQIDQVVNKSDLIVAIQITVVDFQRNTRIITYTSIDNIDLKLIYEKFSKNGPVEVPLFNNDIINNKRLVDLVNGEFICTPYAESIGAKLVPETIQHVSTICANSIPPYYGRFSGIISIYLKRPPTTVEVDQIRAVSKTLGLITFQNDLR